MRTALPSYLLLRPSGYYFRYRVPARLRDVLKCREFKRALKTRDRRHASKLAAALALSADSLCGRLNVSGPLSDESIRELVRRYVDNFLHRDEMRRQKRGPTTFENAEQAHDGYEGFAQDYQQQLTERDYSEIAEEAKELLTHANFEVPDDVVSLRALYRELLKANVRLMRIVAARHLGDYESERQLREPPRDNSGRTQKNSTPLSEVHAAFIDANAASRDWKPDTTTQYRAVVRDLMDIVGDLPMQDIERAHIRQLRDVLLRLPSNRNKRKDYRDKSLKELMAMNVPEPDRLKPKTVHDQMVGLSGFFRWAVHEGYADKNPVDDQLPKLPALDKRTYDQWDTIELQQIFSHPWFSGEAPAPWCFWLPILALYGGQRLGELAMLRVADIIQEGGVTYINITDDSPNKRLKSHAAKRRVPIHNELHRLGFLRYVETCRAAGAQQLWPEITPNNKGKWSDIPSKKFAALFKELGVWGKSRKVFHSFRKSAITNALNKGGADIHVAELMGHESGLITIKVYHRGAPLEQLAGVVNRIDYDGLDLSHLRPPESTDQTNRKGRSGRKRAATTTQPTMNPTKDG